MEERRLDCAAVQRSRLGVLAARHRRFDRRAAPVAGGRARSPRGRGGDRPAPRRRPRTHGPRAPLWTGGATGMRRVATDSVEPVEFVPKRVVAAEPVAAPVAATAQLGVGPLRISGRVGDGLYWSLRAAGASPEVAAQYLSALSTQIDVGDVSPNASFDMVLGPNRQLLYAGLNRVGEGALQP